MITATMIIMKIDFDAMSSKMFMTEDLDTAYRLLSMESDKDNDDNNVNDNVDQDGKYDEV